MEVQHKTEAEMVAIICGHVCCKLKSYGQKSWKGEREEKMKKSQNTAQHHRLLDD